MDAALPIVTIAALLGAIIGFVGPLGWRWQLLRLLPLLILPVALHVLQSNSWGLGGGGIWVTAALAACIGSLGYLPAVLAIAVLRWMMWRQRCPQLENQQRWAAAQAFPRMVALPERNGCQLQGEADGKLLYRRVL